MFYLLVHLEQLMNECGKSRENCPWKQERGLTLCTNKKEKRAYTCGKEGSISFSLFKLYIATCSVLE